MTTHAVSAGRADRLASRFPLHLVTLGTFLYATGPVLARSVDTTGVILSFWRLWFGVALLAASLTWHWRSGRDLGTRRGVLIGMVAGSAFAWNQLLFFSAIKRITVVDATLMTTLSPIVVGVLAYPLFGERPSRSFRAWSVVAISGAVVVVVGAGAGTDGDLVGMGMVLAATLFFACFFLASKAGRAHAPVVTFLTAAMGTAAVLVTGFVAVTGTDAGSISTTDVAKAAAMALVPGTLGHVVMTWPLNYLPANVPPLVRLTGPVMAGLMAWVFLGEGIRFTHLVGGLIIAAGIAGAIGSRGGKELMAQSRSQTHSQTRSQTRSQTHGPSAGSVRP